MELKKRKILEIAALGLLAISCTYSEIAIGGITYGSPQALHRQVDENNKPVAAVRIDSETCSGVEMVHAINGINSWYPHANLTVSIENDPRGDGALLCRKDWPALKDARLGEIWIGYMSTMAVAHEVGHLIGLAHLDDPASLMFEMPDMDLMGPTAVDIAALQELYP